MNPRAFVAQGDFFFWFEVCLTPLLRLNYAIENYDDYDTCVSISKRTD